MHYLILVTLKLLVVASFLVVFLLLLKTAALGREIRLGKSILRAFTTVSHRKYSNRTIVTTIVAIVLTEVLVRMKGEGHFSTLFAVHLCFFAMPFLVTLLILRYALDGHRVQVRYPKLHRNLAYLCITLYVGTFTTGCVLMYRL